MKTEEDYDAWIEDYERRDADTSYMAWAAQKDNSLRMLREKCDILIAEEEWNEKTEKWWSFTSIPIIFLPFALYMIMGPAVLIVMLGYAASHLNWWYLVFIPMILIHCWVFMMYMMPTRFSRWNYPQDAYSL